MSIHEECGVFGVISPKPVDVANISYYFLPKGLWLVSSCFL